MYDKQSDGMQAYRSVRIMRCAEITSILHSDSTDTVNVNCDGLHYSIQGMDHKPFPEPGWWVMFYDDGYSSFCPPESFKNGYVPHSTES